VTVFAIAHLFAERAADTLPRGAARRSLNLGTHAGTGNNPAR